MKQIHVDLMIGAFPVKGTITITQDTERSTVQTKPMGVQTEIPTEEIHYNADGQRLASDAQTYTLKKLNLYKEGMTAKEAYLIIQTHKSNGTPPTKPVAPAPTYSPTPRWFEKTTKKRGRPRRTILLTPIR